ncbi:hypothetical protein EUX98_g4897 [Antrodiella citrinella]|uniref:O-methylsterigmatocystin oxidoreductase n=1 Tax=Antrodiella citrinella TaxID=2447956 RepID=A0A4S4MVB8_9APHY|nr:hypothetical protein EUX98_g4897 [Antrodiella citrinella]
MTRFTQALILDIAYGHQVNTDDDALVKLGESTTHNIALAGSPGSMLVDFFPFLRYYPAWLPGSAWKKHIDYTATMVKKMQAVPYNTVKSSLVCLHLALCLTLIECYLTGDETARYAENEKDIRGAATSLYTVASQIASAMQVFILAMLLHPNVRVKAREEMDRVVGSGRLPELYDRENLPYLNSIIKETYRWHPAVPLGIPHSTNQEDEYNGYTIPNNSMVIGNLWGMSRDEDVYSDPETFLPERFMNTNDALDPKGFVFGFGRRLCPGREFADACIFMVLSNIVATMDFFRAKDEYGNEIAPQATFTNVLASRPERLDCVLKPRTQQAQDLILLQDTDDATFSVQ